MNPMNLPFGGFNTVYHLYGVTFGMLAGLFALTLFKTRERSYLWLSLGMLFCGLAWGTTEWQNVGKVHVDWAWWWAQPLFVGGMVFLSIGAALYLPLTNTMRKVMITTVVGFAGVYLVGVTILLLFGVQVPRLWVLPLLTPAFLVPGLAAIYSSRIEPKMGHSLIGFAQLSILGISLGAPLLGQLTSVIRVWTGVPLLFIGVMTLTISLLRERQKLLDENLARRSAEQKVLENNQLLERRVQERTLDLQEIISGLESFNRDISHDLRGPLGSIDVLSYVAREFIAKGDPASASQPLKEISHLARNTHASVDALLSLAKTAEQDIGKTMIDLDNMAYGAAQEAELSAKAIAASLPRLKILPLGHARAHRDLLRIVLLNLIGNALKFNHSRENVEVIVGRDDGRSTDGWPCLYVQDTGIGFDENQSDAVFEPFMRIAHSSDHIGGHGIGLNIVRRAVLRHHGKVWIRTAPGKGTTVYFTLGPQN